VPSPSLRPSRRRVPAPIPSMRSHSENTIDLAIRLFEQVAQDAFQLFSLGLTRRLDRGSPACRRSCACSASSICRRSNSFGSTVAASPVRGDWQPVCCSPRKQCCSSDHRHENKSSRAAGSSARRRTCGGGASPAAGGAAIQRGLVVAGRPRRRARRSRVEPEQWSNQFRSGTADRIEFVDAVLDRRAGSARRHRARGSDFTRRAS